MSVLSREDQNRVCTLTLNRPDHYNALSEALLDALAEAFDELAETPEVQVIRLRAAGKAFCAGHDLREMRATPEPDYYRALFARCSGVMQRVVNAPQVVVAEVQGIATAAGCQLAASADLVVAARSARFAVSGINLGLFCSTPAVALSRRVGRGRAMKMLMTGQFVDADTACEWGLVEEVAEDAQLSAETTALIEQITAKPLAATRTGKQLFQAQLESGLAEAYRLAGEAMACNIMDEQAAEGIDAFLEKRPPNWG